MKNVKLWILGVVLLGVINFSYAQTRQLENEKLLQEMESKLELKKNQVETLKNIFADSSVMGQGNPAITKHPMTREECEANAKKNNRDFANAEFKKICGGPFMAPLYDPKKQKPTDAKVCIDQFEFPSIPCGYPLVWTKAKEAEMICQAVGKRLCDAHEWEGACAGELGDADYPFELAKGKSDNAGFNAMRVAHNKKYEATKSWAYGNSYTKGICGANSTKDGKCNGGDWQNCGSNTYPSGSFLNCKSKLDVYDQHGNAAEHMNLPLAADQMTSNGSKTLGQTEMKGSWFIFDKYYAHQDWCRWRAPYWHGTKVMSDHSHENYHLGFRCCKSL